VSVTASVDAVERSVQKANEWLADLDAELGRENRDEAWRILRAYLHILRERLTIEEGAHLAAQLPHLLRGVFYEGFQPARPPERMRGRDAFLARLADAASLSGPTDASLAAEATTRVLRRHVSGGEVDEVLAQLPEHVRAVLEPR
jgi:uncharacterized protein (DUF2267 family)